MPDQDVRIAGQDTEIGSRVGSVEGENRVTLDDYLLEKDRRLKALEDANLILCAQHETMRCNLADMQRRLNGAKPA